MTSTCNPNCGSARGTWVSPYAKCFWNDTDQKPNSSWLATRTLGCYALGDPIYCGLYTGGYYTIAVGGGGISTCLTQGRQELVKLTSGTAEDIQGNLYGIRPIVCLQRNEIEISKDETTGNLSFKYKEK